MVVYKDFTTSKSQLKKKRTKRKKESLSCL